MKRHTALLIALICISITSACKRDADSNTYTFPKEASTDFDDIWTMEKVGTKTFDLDSTIGIQSQSIQYYQEDDIEKVSILNPIDHSLHIYDYETRQMTEKVKFELEGNNGIGKSSNMGHFMDRSDSIFLFNHWENRVYLLNQKAEVLNRYNLTDTTLNYEAYLMINSSSPAFKKGSTLYITAQTAGNNITDTDLVITLDLETDDPPMIRTV